jgi:hypothetical protein
MRVWRTLTAASCAGLAALTFGPAFAGARFPVFIAITVALMAIGALALYYSRISKTLRLVCLVGILAVYTWLAVAPGLAVQNGLRRLLSAALPVEAQGPELAVAVLLTGLATIGAVEPILRGRRAVLALAAPLLLAAAGSAIAAPVGNPPAWLAAAFAGCAAFLLWLASRTPARSPDRRVRWLRVVGTAATAVLFGAMATGAAAAGLLQHDDPAQARALLPAPVEPRIGISPLALFPALREGKLPLSLAIESSSADRLRFATLNVFDGTVWTSDARYRWAGRYLPPAPGTVVEDHVQVLRDDGMGWLVASGRPVFVSVGGLGVDEATGDVVIPEGQSPPKSYVVRSAVPPTVSGDTPPDAVAPDCAAPDLAEWARLATGGSHDLAALQRLEAHLADFQRDDGKKAPTGHGIFQLRQLRASRTGTAEQFASAFAVLARCAGFNARVAVGFRPREVRPGEYAVTGEDVDAWPEVRFAGGVWASFDPTPAVADSSQPAEPAPEPSGAQADPSPPPYTGPTGQAAAPPGRTPNSGGPGAMPVVLIGLCVVALYALLVPLLKQWVRLRRQRSGTPQRRAVAAWRDTLDRLGEAAVPSTSADTVGDTVASAGGRFGASVATPLLALAQLHDEAAYSPFLRRELAPQAWHLATQVRKALVARMPLRRRAMALLDPRPLTVSRRRQ